MNFATRIRMTAFLLFIACTVTADARPKIISYAWEWARTGPNELLELQPQIAAAGVDGVELVLRCKASDGTLRSSRRILSEPNWVWDEIKGEVPKFKRLTSLPGLADSSLATFYLPPKRMAWTNDAVWAKAANNMGLIARFSREAGIGWLAIDHEDYPKQRQFQRLPGDPAMRDLVPLVRQRGREVFAAVFREHPDVKLLFFWFMTEHARKLGDADNPLKALVDSGDLWGFFANGILDALPPTAEIHDGNENSYQYEAGEFEYLMAARQIRRLEGMAFPENREKYRRQVRAASALYMDMYTSTNPASAWYKGPSSGSRLGTFRRDLAQAMSASDGVVWTWGESNPLVTRRKRAQDEWEYMEDPIWWRPTFESRVPGASRALRAMKDPAAFLRDGFPAILASGKLTNLVKSDLAISGTWQEEMKGRSVGAFAVDEAAGCSSKPALKLTGVSKGCVNTSVADVKAGEIYVVRIRTKVEAGGFSAHVGWIRQGAWRFFIPVKTLTFGKPDANGWRLGETVAVVPENCDRLVLSFGVTQNAGERCWVDDAEVYRID